MSTHGRRASYWTRWPNETEGPLWAGIHLDERAGVTAIVGVELFTEPPADARMSRGPEADDLANDMFPGAPVALRGADIKGLGLQVLLDRFRGSSEEAAGMAGTPGAKGQRYSDDHWRRVAQYAAASRARIDAGTWPDEKGSTPERVNRAVAQMWSVSVPTAKKWLARCKTLGLITAHETRALSQLNGSTT